MSFQAVFQNFINYLELGEHFHSKTMFCIGTVQNNSHWLLNNSNVARLNWEYFVKCKIHTRFWRLSMKKGKISHEWFLNIDHTVKWYSGYTGFNILNLILPVSFLLFKMWLPEHLNLHVCYTSCFYWTILFR